MISVVIPLYNKERNIATTLRTVFNQTFQDFEIVIVNDGSTDDSVAEVEKTKDSRIRLFHQNNAGVSVARNRGIDEAKGEFIAFLDADDEWKPDYLATQMALAKQYRQCDVFACNYEFRDTEGQVKPTILRKIPFVEETGILSNYFEVASCSHPPICSISIMVRKSAIQSIGGFPVGIKSGEDLLTWARLACKYQIAYSKKVLAVFQETKAEGDTSKIKQRAGKEDYILKELKRMYSLETCTLKKQALKSYIIRWYKIYAVTQIEIEKGHTSFLIALEAIRFGGSLKSFLPIWALSLFPNKCSLAIFKKLRP